MNIRVSQFEKKAGLSNGYFNQVSKKPSDAKLLSIANAHPMLNIDWLCTGRGGMINDVPNECTPELPQDAEVKTMPVQEESLIAELRAQIERLESKIDNLNREVGEQNALIKMLRQRSVESV